MESVTGNLTGLPTKRKDKNKGLVDEKFQALEA